MSDGAPRDPVPATLREADGVALLDAGDRRRLERFGPRIVDRPAPAAIGPRSRSASWDAADLRYDEGAGWTGPAATAGPWPVLVRGLTLELRATASGGVGLYPEHALTLDWLESEVGARARARGAGEAGGGAAPTVLNLFAHTGLTTLALARAGAGVTHVDASRTAVVWARRNAAMSGLGSAPVRWIVDDAASFVAREARRGRRYDGVVLDPPSFGRAGRRQWRLADALPELLDASAAIARPGAFLVLTAHTTGLDAGALRSLVDSTRARWTIGATGPLVLPARSGVSLPAGAFVRGRLAGPTGRPE